MQQRYYKFSRQRDIDCRKSIGLPKREKKKTNTVITYVRTPPLSARRSPIACPDQLTDGFRTGQPVFLISETFTLKRSSTLKIHRNHF